MSLKKHVGMILEVLKINCKAVNSDVKIISVGGWLESGENISKIIRTLRFATSAS